MATITRARTTSPAHLPYWRFDVQLRPGGSLAQFMEFRGVTVRGLAGKVGSAPSTIGHLRSEKRRTCKPDLAQRIEEALEVPRGFLFAETFTPLTSETATAPARRVVGRRPR